MMAYCPTAAAECVEAVGLLLRKFGVLDLSRRLSEGQSPNARLSVMRQHVRLRL